MTKKWKSYLSSPEIESNFHLSVKSKGCLRFYLATFPNNYCLHNASYMTQWHNGQWWCPRYPMVSSRESRLQHVHLYRETCNKDTILYFRYEKREIPAQYVPWNVLQVVTLKFLIPRTQFIFLLFQNKHLCLSNWHEHSRSVHGTTWDNNLSPLAFRKNILSGSKLFKELIKLGYY